MQICRKSLAPPSAEFSMSICQARVSSSLIWSHPSKNQGGGDKPYIVAGTFATVATGSRGGGSHITGSQLLGCSSAVLPSPLLLLLQVLRGALLLLMLL